MLDCLEHTPGEGATSSVIWMHGLGASGNDFVPLVPHIGLPRTRFVFPHAPERPVTINGGMAMPAWYDILTLERGSDRESEPDVREAHGQVEALIAREVARGIPADRIVLAGFSQGAAMTLHSGLRHGARLAGLMVLSGYLVLPEKLEAEAHAANRDTPLLMMHGTRDPTVPHDFGRSAFNRIEAGRPAIWREYGMGHELCQPQLRDIRQWMHERLG